MFLTGGSQLATLAPTWAGAGAETTRAIGIATSVTQSLRIRFSFRIPGVASSLGARLLGARTSLLITDRAILREAFAEVSGVTRALSRRDRRRARRAPHRRRPSS